MHTRKWDNVFIFYAKKKQSQKTIAFFIALSGKSDDGGVPVSLF
jgi:hypothetical protein